MKKLLILTLVVLFPLTIMAQKNEGKIVFTTKMKLKLSGNIVNMLSKEQLKKLQNRIIKKELVFNSRESVYKKYKADEGDSNKEQEFSSEGSTVRIQFKGASNDDQLYYNIAEKQVVDMRSFMGRRFLIKDTPKKATWKLTAESKKILGYNCKKATMDNEKRTVEAWFTMQIPVASGPKGFGQLPGMILELKTTPKAAVRTEETKKEGNKESTSIVTSPGTTITATKITFKKLEKGAIKAPKKGKKVNRKQFKKIVKRKMEEMKDRYRNKGGGIRVERN